MTLLKSGKLWVVATPLGNPGDLSPRAARILASADLVLAEDTRRSGLLLAGCGVKARSFLSFHEHNEEKRLPQVLEALRQGRTLALISDAGTPLLSDPGYRLVRACREQGVAVSPAPGPSAPLAALCASGLPPYPFAFLGFAPRRDKDRRGFFAPYAALPLTLAFFERKDRLQSTLLEAFAVLGERDLCIARELTKTHEEFLRLKLSEAGGLDREFLGEITVLVGPPERPAGPERMEIAALVRSEVAKGGRPREIVRRVQALGTGLSGSEIYELLRAVRPGLEE